MTVAGLAEDLIMSLRSIHETVKDNLPPVDQRIQTVIDKTFPSKLLPADCILKLKLPTPFEAFQIDRANIAFELATPYDNNFYSADGNNNYRIP